VVLDVSSIIRNKQKLKGKSLKIYIYKYIKVFYSERRDECIACRHNLKHNNYVSIFHFEDNFELKIGSS